MTMTTSIQQATLLRAALLAALVAACGGGSKPVATTSSAPTTTTPVAPPADTTPASTPAASPLSGDGPTAEEALAWVLDGIASGKVTQADVEARFAPSFLQAVPAAQVVQIFASLHAQLPPVTIVKQQGKPPLALTALLDTHEGGLQVQLLMSDSRPRQITGLLFKPGSLAAAPQSYDEAETQLDKAGQKSQLFIAELVKGKCTARRGHNASQRLALGSAFKLWVLLAVDEKLRTNKKLSWDTPLAIRDEARSLPSGTMQNDAAGTEHSLREFATQMISISDNTATDHLIDFVGNAAVEKALVLARHGKPAVNVPFYRTREMFGLKLAATADELAAFRKARLAGKRKFLADVRTRPIDLEKAITDWGDTPRALDLEWFASGPELCNVMATLGARGKLDPGSELLTVLGKNAGVEVDRTRFPYVGFKGGSEPGVMNLTWLLRRADDRWFVVVVAVNDETHGLDESLIAGVGQGVLAILGKEGKEGNEGNEGNAP